MLCTLMSYWKKTKRSTRGRPIRMQGNSPSLETRVFTSVSFKDLERNALFSEGLGQRKTAEARSSDEYVHDGD